MQYSNELMALLTKKPLGEGSSRVVYGVSRKPFAVKRATDLVGVLQNHTEFMVYKGLTRLGFDTQHLMKVYDISDCGEFLVVERLTPLITATESHMRSTLLPLPMRSASMLETLRVLESMGVLQHDLLKRSSWGTCKKTGTLKILDYGLSDKVQEQRVNALVHSTIDINKLKL